MATKDPPEAAEEPSSANFKVPIVVATSVMLTFISFWRAAAIVLCDLGSSAFYAGGIAERAIGKTAPWFILAVMLFANAVRGVYIESCVIFVRGGVYRVVKTALGRNFAKVSVSALMFDYILTGPISAVSAGQYLIGLANEILELRGSHSLLPKNECSALLAVLVTLYFWRKNLKGIHESSDKALKIMQITTVMAVLVLAWGAITLIVRGGSLPPLPFPSNLNFSKDALGWLYGSDWHKKIGLLGILIAFGHSVLAMSGEESLAQVNREIAHPKVRNLKRAAFVIFVFTLLFTSLVTFLGVMIIPDEQRPQFYDNLIGGLAMNVVGPYGARLALHVFVVAVGFVVLSGAVNTAIIGSNGVLNRVSEDGVLSAWFRRPHHRFGTSYRIINMIAILQIGTIVISRGETYVLGEAYAFGVIWSFVFNATSMFVLRYKLREPREWKVPVNLKIGRTELPLGILFVLTILLLTAVVNLLTKQVATISGLVFTAGFFTLFNISEHMAKRAKQTSHLDQFQLIRQETIDVETVRVRPAPVLVSVRDYRSLHQLDRALADTDTANTDVVVMTARMYAGAGAGYKEIHEQHLFTEYEQQLFTAVVQHAEKLGKPVKLLVTPTNNPFSAVVNVANRLGAIRVYAGTSEKLSVGEQARILGREWEELNDPEKVQFDLLVVSGRGEAHRFQIGAHTPEITPEDVDRIHKIWLEIVESAPGLDFHHRDVVSLALQRFERELSGASRAEILGALAKKLPRKEHGRRAARG
jgi:amino acid transporter